MWHAYSYRIVIRIANYFLLDKKVTCLSSFVRIQDEYFLFPVTKKKSLPIFKNYQ